MQVRISAAWAWLAWLHHTVGAPGALANGRAGCRSCFPRFLALASIVELLCLGLAAHPCTRLDPLLTLQPVTSPLQPPVCARLHSLPATDQPPTVCVPYDINPLLFPSLPTTSLSILNLSNQLTHLDSTPTSIPSILLQYPSLPHKHSSHLQSR